MAIFAFLKDWIADRKGDRMAVVGVNGAGKSTLARILAGVEPYQKGSVMWGLIR